MNVFTANKPYYPKSIMGFGIIMFAGNEVKGF